MSTYYQPQGYQPTRPLDFDNLPPVRLSKVNNAQIHITSVSGSQANISINETRVALDYEPIPNMGVEMSQAFHEFEDAQEKFEAGVVYYQQELTKTRAQNISFEDAVQMLMRNTHPSPHTPLDAPRTVIPRIPAQPAVPAVLEAVTPSITSEVHTTVMYEEIKVDASLSCMGKPLYILDDNFPVYSLDRLGQLDLDSLPEFHYNRLGWLCRLWVYCHGHRWKRRKVRLTDDNMLLLQHYIKRGAIIAYKGWELLVTRVGVVEDKEFMVVNDLEFGVVIAPDPMLWICREGYVLRHEWKAIKKFSKKLKEWNIDVRVAV